MSEESLALPTESKQIPSGAACLRCRNKKVKCDGKRPCHKCIATKALCQGDKDDHRPAVHGSLEVRNGVQFGYPRSMEGGKHSGNWEKNHTVQCYSDNTATGVPESKSHSRDTLFLRRLVDFGFRSEQVQAISDNAPLKLQDMLKALALHFEMNVASNPREWDRDPLPDLDVTAFDPDHAVHFRTVNTLNPDGTSMAVVFTPRCEQVWGSRPDELSRRASMLELPLLTSQYRHLCFAVQCYRSLLSGQPLRTVQVWRKNVCNGKDCGTILVRVTARAVVQEKLFTHYIFDAQEISPEEYDMERSARRSEDFLECSLTGRELVEEKNQLEQQESIESMMATPGGRDTLDRLAGRIRDAFILRTYALG
mmetsp:Transcript_53188/g.108523  ORF Transcript_53188/g.108523 Transcript_53188/m.108523 type:complete len:366 (+) Transcript_53188:157-1254(+)|eukprot:CAMPEP_0181295470 /NCGR_PEP_ID=MMETSP1101-20121128/4169_1 /TAXON_ID=46948 /ORGANISM="Rhodomonas abbreviata, Strain Caron Lab Isolate" /LENGTH=365 /DNA_ID=CAMNT_0023400233 /DNA_START=135 /DNA_END=1232 /DNA_ORIENTATION=-